MNPTKTGGELMFPLSVSGSCSTYGIHHVTLSLVQLLSSIILFLLPVLFCFIV